MIVERFDELHATLARLGGEHEVMCAGPQPTGEAIAAIRWRLAQCGHSRIQFLVGTALPAARLHCLAAERARLDAFGGSIATYQKWIADYVGRWSTAAIEADWAAYQRAAVAFRTGIRARVAEEQAVLRPILLRAARIAKAAA